MRAKHGLAFAAAFLLTAAVLAQASVGKLGFCYIGVPITPDCAGKELLFDVWAGGTKPKSSDSAVNIHTPPYGRAASANVVLKK
jgi:hypothetical protein